MLFKFQPESAYSYKEKKCKSLKSEMASGQQTSQGSIQKRKKTFIFTVSYSTESILFALSYKEILNIYLNIPKYLILFTLGGI